jgi:prepilin-type N-terminal cleavage/methylation domain-containing protein
MGIGNLRRRDKGFTIVEMIIVVIVIGILAGIVLVAYTGAQKQAKDSLVKSELANAQKQVQEYFVNNGKFPTAINSCPNPAATSICYKPAGGVTMSYFVDNSATPEQYYINGVTGTSSFRLASNDPEAVATTGKKVVYTNYTEATGANEFLKYADIAPVIDTNGLVPYVISFDIKSASTATNSNATVYQQNGSGAKYSFSVVVPVTTSYVRKSITVTPTVWMGALTESWLAFYGTYSTGNVLSVKNVVIELAN